MRSELCSATVGTSLSGRGKSMCKVPGVGIYLACSWNSKEDPVARAEWGGEERGGGEGRLCGALGPWAWEWLGFTLGGC